MKPSVSTPTGRADVSHYGASGYQVTGGGTLRSLDRAGRAPATWSRVSPAVLGEIDRYVRTLTVI
jgi:hypothetical protein